MNNSFQSDFFVVNRARLVATLPDVFPAVVPANGLLQRAGDNTFPFHQDSNFWYLTGIDEPDIALVIDRNEEYLIVPERSVSRRAFDGALDLKKLMKVSGVGAVYDEKEGWDKLRSAIRLTKSVAMPLAHPAYIEQHGMFTNPARANVMRLMQDAQPELTIHDMRASLAKLRMIKQPIEIAAIQKAIDITIDGITTLVKDDNMQAYQAEYEAEADLSRFFRMNGATGHAFAPIIAAGKRACTLHNVANNGTFAANQLVILDVGAEISHYCADITRTVSYGEPTKRQADVHAAVLQVQTYALGLLKPGIVLKDYEKQVEVYMGEKLQELGLITNNTHEEIRKYFPHSTSHFLGLDVHDVGDYEQPLLPGTVLTCEPGIYISDESIGVRIEDDVIITKDGNQVLSAHLPKTLM